MAENSKFVLRWEIDNPAAALGFILKTNSITVFLHHHVKFNDGEPVHAFNDALPWLFLTNSEYHMVVNNKLIVEFRVKIIRSEQRDAIETAPVLDLAKFRSPNEISNVTLEIGDKKLQVSKDYLAMHSPYFTALFFGDFAESGKDEVELKDVVYEEFIDLLHVIYSGRFVKITDSTVSHILELGDLFQMERVLDLSERYIRYTKKFETEEKLRIADQYRLDMLKDYCLLTYSSSSDIEALESTSQFSAFSADLKEAICERNKRFVNAMK